MNLSAEKKSTFSLVNRDSTAEANRRATTLKRLLRVRARTQQASNFEQNPAEDFEIERGPELQVSAPAKRSFEMRNNSKLLTTQDFLSVERATIRESNEHRAWPPDVVLKFMSADVLTRK